jgi:hypothetical protein
MSFRRHTENIQVGPCAECKVITLLHWHFGSKQEHKLCDVCGEARWMKLLAEVGRLEEWERMIA